MYHLADTGLPLNDIQMMSADHFHMSTYSGSYWLSVNMRVLECAGLGCGCSNICAPHGVGRLHLKSRHGFQCPINIQPFQLFTEPEGNSDIDSGPWTNNAKLHYLYTYILAGLNEKMLSNYREPLIYSVHIKSMADWSIDKT